LEKKGKKRYAGLCRILWFNPLPLSSHSKLWKKGRKKYLRGGKGKRGGGETPGRVGQLLSHSEDILLTL